MYRVKQVRTFDAVHYVHCPYLSKYSWSLFLGTTFFISVTELYLMHISTLLGWIMLTLSIHCCVILP